MKSAGTVVKGQDLDPEEIRADQSSLSTTIPDKSSNIKSVVSSRRAALVFWEDHRPDPQLCLYPQLSPCYSFSSAHVIWGVIPMSEHLVSSRVHSGALKR